MHPKTQLFTALLAVLTTDACNGLIWPVGAPDLPADAPGPLRQVGTIRYSFLKVLGGSCVLLSDRHALTAAHGVRKWSAAQLSLRFPHFTKKQDHRIERITLHPRVDLALITLKNAIPNLPPLASMGTSPPRPGTKVILGGFGLSGPLNQPRPPGTFHRGENQIIKLFQDRLILRTPAQTSAEKTNFAAAAKMDSGSPLFLKKNDNYQLVGLALTSNYHLTKANPVRNTYLDLSKYQKWINSQSKEKTARPKDSQARP